MSQEMDDLAREVNEAFESLRESLEVSVDSLTLVGLAYGTPTSCRGKGIVLMVNGEVPAVGTEIPCPSCGTPEPVTELVDYGHDAALAFLQDQLAGAVLRLGQS